MIMKILQFAAISLVITLVIAVVLILSQRPTKMTVEGGLDFDQTLAKDAGPAAPLTEVTMRDGYPLKLRHYEGPAPDAPMLVLVHGSGWHGLQFDTVAKVLSAQAEVLAPDLRGHGTAPGRRGDIDYIGQLEDDLVDLINAKQKAGQKLILVGHSSGGGLVTRFAGGAHGGMMDGAVLLAPFLKHNAPTTRQNAGGWSEVLMRRIIGLSMLNTFRIRALNHLTIIQFAMPPEVINGELGDTATTSYSYRLNMSFAPRSDYLGDVAKLPRFLLIAGAQDEAFFADRYKQTMTPATDKGRFEVIPDTGHLDVVDEARTANLIKEFLNEF